MMGIILPDGLLRIDGQEALVDIIQDPLYFSSAETNFFDLPQGHEKKAERTDRKDGQDEDEQAKTLGFLQSGGLPTIFLFQCFGLFLGQLQTERSCGTVVFILFPLFGQILGNQVVRFKCRQRPPFIVQAQPAFITEPAELFFELLILIDHVPLGIIQLQHGFLKFALGDQNLRQALLGIGLRQLLTLGDKDFDSFAGLPYGIVMLTVVAADQTQERRYGTPH